MRFGKVLASLVLAQLLVLDCGARAAEPLPVSIGIVGALSDVVIFIAEKKGYLKEEGFEPKLLMFPSAANMVAPLGAGQLDVGAGSTSAGLFNAVAQGVKLRIVADKASSRPGYGVTQLIIAKRHIESGRYKGFADLKGMKIAQSGTGTPNVVTLADIAKLGGLRPTDVENTILPFPNHVVALENGAVDGSIASEPTASVLLKRGLGVSVKRDDEVVPNHSIGQLLYSEGFAARPEVAKRFVRAYLRAARFYNDALKDGKLAGPTAPEVVEILTQSTPFKDPGLFRSILPHGLDPDGRVSVASLEHDMAFYRSLNLIVGEVKVAQVVDMSFVDAVLKEIGPYKKAN
jgi:NitT/TauT family transport system substrate-binding protein